MLSGYLSLSRRSATAPPSGGAINRLRTGGSSWDVFRFRARNRRRSADEEKLLRNTSCSGGQDPYRICGNCVHTVMRRLSPAASWPSPLGKVPSLSRRMRACRQLAQHSAIFCFVQSLIRRYAPASPKGSLRTHRASCSYGGAGTPIHPPYFTTFPAASQARRQNFSPIFQKYVRACLNLSKRGRIIKKLTTLLSEDHFHECTRCKRRLQLAQVSAV